MRIDSLHLQNFRGFRDLKIDFPTDNNIAVFIGINGAGKSSILDALTILLSRFAAKLIDVDPRSAAFPFTEDDFSFDSNLLTLRMSLNLSDRDHSDFVFEVSRADRNSRGIKGDIDCISKLKNQLSENLSFNLPILVYYPTTRLISEQKIGKKNKSRLRPLKYPQLNAYTDSFLKSFTSFDTFIIWFADEENLENQIISREEKNYVNPNLRIVRESIEEFFSQLTLSKFSKLRVNRFREYDGFSYSSHINTTLEIDKNSDPFKVTQLSDGEKNLLVMVCDIARRLTIANPSLSNSREGQGIVLIDEIDAHLHPQWQREVIPAFQKTFPNCQFITTTHSPQVLSNLEPESIFILEDWNVLRHNPCSYGRDTNSILYEFMGVSKRPEWTQKQIDDCFKLIDKLIKRVRDQEDFGEVKVEPKDLKEAQEAIQELQKYLGQNDPDIVQANTILHFFEFED